MGKNETKKEKDVKKVSNAKNEPKKAVKKAKTTKNENVKEKKVTKKSSDNKEVKKVSENKKIKKVTEENKISVKEDLNDNVKVEENNVEENKEVSKKNSLSTILVIGCILLIGIAFGISILETKERNKYYKTVSYDEVVEMMGKDEISVIYYGSPSCGYCSMFAPIVKEVSYEEKVYFHYLNAANLVNDDYANLYTHLTNFDEVYATEDLGTPSLILIKNGAILDLSEGYIDKAEIVKFLEKNGVIEAELDN